MPSGAAAQLALRSGLWTRPAGLRTGDPAEVAAAGQALAEDEPRTLAALGTLLRVRWPEREAEALANGGAGHGAADPGAAGHLGRRLGAGRPHHRGGLARAPAPPGTRAGRAGLALPGRP